MYVKNKSFYTITYSMKPSPTPLQGDKRVVSSEMLRAAVIKAMILHRKSIVIRR